MKVGNNKINTSKCTQFKANLPQQASCDFLKIHISLSYCMNHLVKPARDHFIKEWARMLILLIDSDLSFFGSPPFGLGEAQRRGRGLGMEKQWAGTWAGNLSIIFGSTNKVTHNLHLPYIPFKSN